MCTVVRFRGLRQQPADADESPSVVEKTFKKRSKSSTFVVASIIALLLVGCVVELGSPGRIYLLVMMVSRMMPKFDPQYNPWPFLLPLWNSPIKTRVRAASRRERPLRSAPFHGAWLSRGCELLASSDSPTDPLAKRRALPGSLATNWPRCSGGMTRRAPIRNEGHGRSGRSRRHTRSAG